MQAVDLQDVKIEAFQYIHLTDDLKPVVRVKFVDHEDPTWMLLSDLKDEIAPKTMRQLLADLQDPADV
jgi:hypothetical protein